MHETLRDMARELAERYRTAETVEGREGYRQALRHLARVREELRFAENAEADPEGYAPTEAGE